MDKRMNEDRNSELRNSHNKSITMRLSLALFVTMVALCGCTNITPSATRAPDFQVRPQIVGEPLRVYASRSVVERFQGHPLGDEKWSGLLMTCGYSESPLNAKGEIQTKNRMLGPCQTQKGASQDVVVLEGAVATEAGYWAIQLLGPNGPISGWMIIEVKKN